MKKITLFKEKNLLSGWLLLITAFTSVALALNSIYN